MTISWISLTSQPNRFQRPQRQLRYTLHASAHVPVVMRMKTTKTPSLIEYSAIPTSARRKTTTKFIYFVFLLTWTRIRNYEPSILAYDGWTEIVHAFDRTFNVGFLRTRKHTFTGMRSREKKSNYIQNYFDCQHLRATEWLSRRRVPSVFVVQLKLHCSLHKKYVVLLLRAPSTHIKSKI